MPSLPPISVPALSVAAGLFLRRYDIRRQAWRWLLLRNRRRKDWGFPKGHQESGEDMPQTALRECAEETGIALLTMYEPPYELTYDLPSGRRKRVVYFAATTLQEQLRLSREHDAAEWLSRRQALERLGHKNLCCLFRAHLAELPSC